MENIVEKTKKFVEETLRDVDPSHDFQHILRVYRMATRIAEVEGGDMELVQLAALLHDIADWKYSGSEEANLERAREFLTAQNYPAERAEKILAIIHSVGFHSELGGVQAETLEAKIVQDADRLDAMGAIGVARAISYGAVKKRVLHDPERMPRGKPTKEKYMSQKAEDGTTINHFHEKLLLLQGLLKTESGRKIGGRRHDFMRDFLHEFIAEWGCLA